MCFCSRASCLLLSGSAPFGKSRLSFFFTAASALLHLHLHRSFDLRYSARCSKVSRIILRFSMDLLPIVIRCCFDFRLSFSMFLSISDLIPYFFCSDLVQSWMVISQPRSRLLFHSRHLHFNSMVL